MPEHHHRRAERTLTGDVRVDSGISEHSDNFVRKYTIRPGFDIDCSGCCWEYLTTKRNYDTVQDRRMVKFGNATTSCYVDGPQGRNGKNGVVKTESDLNLGNLGPRPVQGSFSYQLYGRHAPGGLAVGAEMTATIEAISVNKLKKAQQIQNCYFSYADAALLELYREKEEEPSLRGTCCWPPQDKKERDTDELASSVRKMRISK